MPAPSPDAILDTPPPLTPEALRNFPYRPRAFPAVDLAQSLRIGAPAGQNNSTALLPDNRVE